MENYNTIKYKFECGAYTLENMCRFVRDEFITKDEFKYITSYNYDSMKKEG